MKTEKGTRVRFRKDTPQYAANKGTVFLIDSNVNLDRDADKKYVFLCDEKDRTLTRSGYLDALEEVQPTRQEALRDAYSEAAAALITARKAVRRINYDLYESSGNESLHLQAVMRGLSGLVLDLDLQARAQDVAAAREKDHA